MVTRIGSLGFTKCLDMLVRLVLIALLPALLGASACGVYMPEDPQELAFAELAASRKKGFNGVWNLKLTSTRDTCGLKLKKGVKTKVAIVQKGNRAIIQAQGLPKYKGSVKGNRLTAAGKYKQEGLSITGSLSATQSGARRLTVTNSTINIKQGKKSCSVSFRGTGTKAKG